MDGRIHGDWLIELGFQWDPARPFAYRLWLEDELFPSCTCFLQILSPDEEGGAWHAEIVNELEGSEPAIAGIPRPLGRQSQILLLMTACGAHVPHLYALLNSPD